MRVTASPGGHAGTIEGGFGKSGKFRVRFDVPLPSGADGEALRLELRFRRYMFDDDRRRMVQN